LVARTLAKNRQGPYDREIALENKWRASRHGLDATFYDAVEGISIPARKMARTLVHELHPVSQDLGCENELLDVLEIVENGSGSQHQRRVYEKSNNFLDVVNFLIENTLPTFSRTTDLERIALSA
jgi:carboxylate-amine ligase